MAERTTSNAGAPSELPTAYERWRDSRPRAHHRHPGAGSHPPSGRSGGRVAAGRPRFGNRPRPSHAQSRRPPLAAAAVMVQLSEASAETLPFENDSFDVVSAVTVLCFVREPERAIREMARVLKPGGRIVLGELGRYSSWAAWRRLRGWLGHPTWRAARFRTGGKLRDLATGAGLVVETVRAAVFYPLSVGLPPCLLPWTDMARTLDG